MITYSLSERKVEVSPSWTKYLLTTHPIEFITTIGKVNGRFKTDIALV